MEADNPVKFTACEAVNVLARGLDDPYAPVVPYATCESAALSVVQLIVALDAVTHFSCVRRVYYVDYASSRLPQNLDAQQRDMESSVFAVTLAGIQALDHRTSWHHYDRSFVGRNYFRVQEPVGRCDTSVMAAAH